MLLSRLYYDVKPWIPNRLRLALRRMHARRVLKRSGDVWPILESAAAKPDGWPGWPDGKQFAFVLTHDVEGPAGLANVKPLAELDRRRRPEFGDWR
jgi:hypothetical protein